MYGIMNGLPTTSPVRRVNQNQVHPLRQDFPEPFGEALLSVAERLRAGISISVHMLKSYRLTRIRFVAEALNEITLLTIYSAMILVSQRRTRQKIL